MNDDDDCYDGYDCCDCGGYCCGCVVGSNKIEGRWTVEDSEVLKCSLAKGMYEKLFLWIIKKLNADIEPQGGKFDAFMGKKERVRMRKSEKEKERKSGVERERL